METSWNVNGLRVMQQAGISNDNGKMIFHYMVYRDDSLLWGVTGLDNFIMEWPQRLSDNIIRGMVAWEVYQQSHQSHQ